MNSAALRAASQVATAQKLLSLEGIFAVNKPPGISCAGLLDYMKRNLRCGPTAFPFAEHFQRERHLREAQAGHKIKRRKYQHNLRLGHGGTLDVEAAGVLVLGVGQGCKQLQGFLHGNKTYLAAGRLGAATDSYDVEGKVTELKDAGEVAAEALLEQIPGFVGDIMQRPPVFSAIKVGGKRLYEYARQGHPIPDQLKLRPVTVNSIKLMHFSNPRMKQEYGTQVGLPPACAEYYRSGNYQWHESASELKLGQVLLPYRNDPQAPTFQLLIRSQGGVYVRSLIHDLGQQIRCPAAMSSLLRVTQGPIRLRHDTIEPEDLAHVDRVREAIRHCQEILAKGI